ncbi:hypothetical protein [Halosegnis longus]|uniref:Uncharacterized protein n=1 Tax=Halosegnis longus TaxID=2216012 RepID=A0AAJ4R6I0_9EURY|nr:hypothetical protein Nmn1133_01365 [Salella cibi]
MEYNENLAQKGQKRPLQFSEFDQDTVKEGVEVPVWEMQVAQDESLWFGYGVRVRDYAESFVAGDLVASGAGAASAAGDPINGEVILAIVNSRRNRVIDSVTFESLSELRDAMASERTKKPVMAALAPYAKPGRYLQVRIKADADSDGYEIDPAASEGKLYYGQQS